MSVTLMMNSLSDWIQDKISSKFVFPALCWEKSLILIEIWNAGNSTSNLIESVHADVNQEGVGCTLVGAVIKGQAFDTMKRFKGTRTISPLPETTTVTNTAQTLEDLGIRTSAGHLSENASKSVKQKCKYLLLSF